MKRTMSKEEFLALYKRQQSSGLTIKDFCDNESYPVSCFHYRMFTNRRVIAEIKFRVSI